MHLYKECFVPLSNRCEISQRVYPPPLQACPRQLGSCLVFAFRVEGLSRNLSLSTGLALDTYIIFFYSCSREERSLFEFEVTTLEEQHLWLTVNTKS